MSHTVIIINRSLLDIFDPNDSEYAGTRDHFTSEELQRIDTLRAVDENTYHFTLLDKIFVSSMLTKAVMLADNIA